MNRLRLFHNEMWNQQTTLTEYLIGSKHVEI